MLNWACMFRNIVLIQIQHIVNFTCFLKSVIILTIRNLSATRSRNHLGFVSVRPLTNPAALDTVLAFPPGYLRAFRYNLACELAAEFGVEPSPQVQRIAMYSKRNLKRINNPDDLMAMPAALMVNRPRFNIFTGNF